MKKIKYFALMVLTFLITSPVYADITCKKVQIDEKIPNTVNKVIFFLQVAVPILLVIFGSIDLIKAVTSGMEDEIKKAQNVFVRRLISGAFVVVIVKMIFSFASDDKDGSMWKCACQFINGANSTSCKK